MEVTVIIASFGDDRWLHLANDRAVPSASAQAPVRVYHSETVMSVGECRNRAVERFDPQGWICFLDPDDELADGYIDAMTSQRLVETDLYVPALQDIRRSRPGPAKILKDRDIRELNPCPIGTLIHRSTFEHVGRFWNEPAWEDWSLFRRVVLDGGSITFVPSAVYRAHVSVAGRNSNVTNPAGLRAEIIASHERWMSDRAAGHH